MPIGSSKLGVLGAGLVPGGSVTFNTSGNWTVPPGVKKVSITGKGATGNPGNSGNPGNAGNPGSGGGGGGSGRSDKRGGAAFNSGPITALNSQINQPQASPDWNILPAPNPLVPRVVTGGVGPPPGAPGNPGTSGNSGNSGSSGNAGSSGNSGQASSGLGNTFPGGAGGNAGTAGNAGTGGSGGQGGSGCNRGFPLPCGSNAPIIGGCGGNGGGNGGTNISNAPGNFNGANGGGGAGATNDGQPGNNPSQAVGCQFPSNVSSGGNDANACAMATLTPRPVFPWPYSFPNNGGVNLAGGRGASENDWGHAVVSAYGIFRIPTTEPLVGYQPGAPAPLVPGPGPGRMPQVGARFNTTPDSSNLWRAGGGGASGVSGPRFSATGAAGGGGRGNAGNAGNAGGAGGTGVAATPQTFNCVTVTPGSTTPIVVASPGGQVVISWNPQ
jgi:hypothetical protein